MADLPFGSYEVSDEQAVETAQRFIKTMGCDAVKIERGGSSVDRAPAIIAAGIPVMGHVGLTPQTASTIGGYRSQGRTAEEALAVCDSALALFNDPIAIGVMQSAAEAGVVVPDELSVAGFDDIFGSQLIVPALTTVRSRLENAGRRAPR